MISAASSAGTDMIATPATVSEVTGAQDRDHPLSAQKHHASLVFEFDCVRAVHGPRRP
ncbi:hypothetical protein [Allorhizocola rhizosphaerae]|uniref:hypothetical protein n=1 Tax=Allorhizocola rhizosphaerae TaxID=1872709 RepID=UPI0013C30B72|nr:hypothetical protein [Allorhizocola rhizosphaerae]